jgi:hypothetical protein
MRDDVCHAPGRCVQESYTAVSYTQEGLDHINATNFRSLLLRHYPELEVRPCMLQYIICKPAL